MGTHEKGNTARQSPSSLAVVSAVAKQTGVPEESLHPPLFDVIDPDALNAVLTSQSTTETAVSVSFDYAGYRITVDSDQAVTVK